MRMHRRRKSKGSGVPVGLVVGGVVSLLAAAAGLMYRFTDSDKIRAAGRRVRDRVRRRNSA